MGRSKKYRRPAVDDAVLKWKAEFGDRPFDANDLLMSGFIQFKMKHQFITITSLRVILKSMVSQGKLVIDFEDPKERNRYKVP